MSDSKLQSLLQLSSLVALAEASETKSVYQQLEECTAYRLAMLGNDYPPLPNYSKKCFLKGWSVVQPDRDMVIFWEWYYGAWLATGMRVDGDIGFIDFDIPDIDLVHQLVAALDSKFPNIFEGVLVRHAGGPKRAFIARIDKPIAAPKSRKWYPGGDVNDPAIPKYRVECFGSLAVRQFGIDGPHSYGRYHEVLARYQFVDGRSPATVPRSELPILPRAVYYKACDLFDEIAKAAGLQIVPEKGRNSRSDGRSRIVYDLTDDMEFENDRGCWGLGELKAELDRARSQNRDFRVTSSFTGDGGGSGDPRKCQVGWSEHLRCITVCNHKDNITHVPVDARKWRNEQAIERLRIKLFGLHAPVPGLEQLARDGAEGDARASTITQLTSMLLNHRIDIKTAHERLQSWNAARCRPPLSPREVTTIVGSICRRELERRTNHKGAA
jgi:hypothetical protein